MGTKKIEAVLDTYAALQEHARAQAASYAAERDALLERIDPAIRDTLARLEAEEQTAMAELQAQLSELASTIKHAVAPLGHSVKGAAYQAVYTPGRPLWNDAMLQGFALAYPTVMDARSVSEPSVSLRPVKAKESR